VSSTIRDVTAGKEQLVYERFHAGMGRAQEHLSFGGLRTPTTRVTRVSGAARDVASDDRIVTNERQKKAKFQRVETAGSKGPSRPSWHATLRKESRRGMEKHSQLKLKTPSGRLRYLLRTHSLPVGRIHDAMDAKQCLAKH
jgi:hypothetical protein